MASYHQKSPLSIFKNRFDQRVYSSGGHPMEVRLSNGAFVPEAEAAAWYVLTNIPAPSPDHPTWYVKDKTNVSLFDIYGYTPPWSGLALADFFWGLIDREWGDWTTRDFTLSRYNAITRTRDPLRLYVVDNPNLLCIESRYTNVNRKAA